MQSTPSQAVSFLVYSSSPSVVPKNPNLGLFTLIYLQTVSTRETALILITNGSKQNYLCFLYCLGDTELSISTLEKPKVELKVK